MGAAASAAFGGSEEAVGAAAGAGPAAAGDGKAAEAAGEGGEGQQEGCQVEGEPAAVGQAGAIAQGVQPTEERVEQARRGVGCVGGDGCASRLAGHMLGLNTADPELVAMRLHAALPTHWPCPPPTCYATGAAGAVWQQRISGRGSLHLPPHGVPGHAASAAQLRRRGLRHAVPGDCSTAWTAQYAVRSLRCMPPCMPCMCGVTSSFGSEHCAIPSFTSSHMGCLPNRSQASVDAFTFGLDVKPDSSMVITSTLGNVRVGSRCTGNSRCHYFCLKCFHL